MDYMVVIDYANDENLKKLCLNCNKLNTEDYWCKECSPKLLQQDFPNWTSGNEFIDRFIQETQLYAQNGFEILEWIPYHKLVNIKCIDIKGFRVVYKAI